jgi:hypothetical protein
MLNVVILNVVIPNAVMLNAIILSVVAPYAKFQNLFYRC